MPSWVSLQEVRKLTGLEKYPVEEIFEEFALAADEEGLLDRDAFETCFESVIEAAGGDANSDRTLTIIDRLFEIFDQDGNGAVDFSELASGLSVLCGGSRDDKAAAAFSLYDYNG